MEDLRKKIQDYFNREGNLVLAGVYTNTGEFIYTTNNYDVSTLINEGAFSILNDVKDFMSNEDNLDHIFREARDHLIIIKKVDMNAIADTPFLFHVLCVNTRDNYGALLLRSKRFEKILLS